VNAPALRLLDRRALSQARPSLVTMFHRCEPPQVPPERFARGCAVCTVTAVSAKLGVM
jgi:hypothetical protein